MSHLLHTLAAEVVGRSMGGPRAVHRAGVVPVANQYLVGAAVRRVAGEVYLLVRGQHELRQVVARQLHGAFVQAARGDRQRVVVHLLGIEALRQLVDADHVVQTGYNLAQFLLHHDVAALERLAVDTEGAANEGEEFQDSGFTRATAG